MKKIDVFILGFVLFIGLIFRLYRINIPLADFHSWRQADTAAVARNFVRSGFDLMHPRFDDLSNVQSGFENPQGYRMVEFPIYNAIFAAAYKIYPSIPIEQWGRIISIFFSLITISIIYFLALMEKSRVAAFFAAFIYAVFPFFVFFSRVVLPEPTAVGFSFLAIFFLYIASTKNSLRNTLSLGISMICFAAALLIKPTTIFFIIPLAYIFYRQNKLKLFKNPWFYLYFLISIAPMLIWRNFIKTFPEGVPINEWLLTSVNTGGSLQKIFFRPAFFRWIFLERINSLILGGYLTVFFIIGIIAKNKRIFSMTLLASSFLFLFVFQGGNVQHVYYQTLILPSLEILCGFGIAFLFENKKIIYLSLSVILIIVSFAFSWFFSYYQVKDYYQYSTDLVQMAKVINSLTNQDDKIVTDRMGDTTLLYLADRKGAPSIFKMPEDLKISGYKYLVTSSSDEIKIMKNEYYKVVFENDQFSLFEL